MFILSPLSLKLSACNKYSFSVSSAHSLSSALGCRKGKNVEGLVFKERQDCVGCRSLLVQIPDFDTVMRRIPC